tara:strand:+ start:57 stop:329 length:273 start_codon:yes stop_codon:yes gene_type:complete
MSVKHYKPATAKETAAQRKAKKDWDKMTPAQKKRASTMSTLAKKVAKKTDPEKPYYTKPTPGKGGKWNIAKATPKKKKTVAKKPKIRKLA